MLTPNEENELKSIISGAYSSTNPRALDNVLKSIEIKQPPENAAARAVDDLVNICRKRIESAASATFPVPVQENLRKMQQALKNSSDVPGEAELTIMNSTYRMVKPAKSGRKGSGGADTANLSNIHSH